MKNDCNYALLLYKKEGRKRGKERGGKEGKERRKIKLKSKNEINKYPFGVMANRNKTLTEWEL